MSHPISRCKTSGSDWMFTGKSTVSKPWHVIIWKLFSRYWFFARGIHRWPYKGQWRGAFMFSLIGTWLSGWVTNGEAGDLRRHPAHYDVIVMVTLLINRYTVKPVCNDHLYNKIYYLWFIQLCVLMKNEGANLLLLIISAFRSSFRWPLVT